MGGSNPSVQFERTFLIDFLSLREGVLRAGCGVMERNTFDNNADPIRMMKGWWGKF